MKLKWIIARPVLFLMLLSTLLATAMGYVIIKNSVDNMMESLVESNLETLVSQVERAKQTEQVMIDEMNNRNLAVVRTLADNFRLSELGGTLDFDDTSFFQDVADLINVNEINITDESGTIIGSNFPDNYGFNYSSAESTLMYMQILDDPAFEITEEPRACAVSGNMFQYLAVARTGTKGFVQIGFDANATKELRGSLDVIHTAADMYIGASGHAAILQNGIIIYSKYTDTIGQDVTGSVWYTPVSSGRGSNWLDIDGETYFAGYANIDGTTLLVLFPQSEHYGYIAPVSIVGVVGLILAVLVAVSIYILVSRISAPISELGAAADKVAGGDLNVQIRQVKGNNEISLLSSRMREMIQQLGVARQSELEAISIRHEKEKAEAENRAKTNFLATMSHEIRTPLNAIIGIAQIELSNEELPDKHTDAFDKIYSSGHNLLRIINDILDMSKIETGKMELNPAIYDVPNLINDTVQLNIVRIGKNPIEFKLDIDETLPLQLYGDELRLKQILGNLLSNAIKYTEIGYVKLTVATAAPGRPCDDVTLTFIVEDTGQGIKPDEKSQLFSEYLRFNVETNRATEGAGLGLSITKRLVEMMGGTIEVESEYGKGSTFTVTVKQKPVECPAIGAELAKQLNSFSFIAEKQAGALQITREIMPYGSVLVVDDVDTNLYVAEGLLAPYKLKTETAGSGFDTIEKVSSGKTYDVIFMDHMMPQMDGIETTKKLRSRGYAGVIIALTANALVGNDEMFMQNGFDGFISKPIDIRQLNNMLNKFIRDKYPEEAGKYKPETAEQAETPGTDPKVRQIFRGEAERAVVTLRKTSESGDIKLFTTTVHAMKAALANIGEHDASALASELEDAGTRSDTAFIAANTEAFIETLEAFIKMFAQDESGDAIGEDITEDTMYLSEQLYIAKTACEEYDTAAAYAALERLKEKPWKAQTAASIEKIHDTLYLNSDFDKAAEMIVSLLESDL